MLHPKKLRRILIVAIVAYLPERLAIYWSEPKPQRSGNFFRVIWRGLQREKAREWNDKRSVSAHREYRRPVERGALTWHAVSSAAAQHNGERRGYQRGVAGAVPSSWDTRVFWVPQTSSQTRQFNSRGCLRRENGESEASLVKFREVIGVVLALIGLVMVLAAVKAGTSLLVILGITLIVIGLAIVNWGVKYVPQTCCT
jgi:hypothetical protein